MRSGDVIELIEAHAKGDEKKWLDTLEEMVKWERQKGNDVLADYMMRAMWDGRKEKNGPQVSATDGRVLTILEILYTRGYQIWGFDQKIEELLGQLRKENGDKNEL